MGYIYAFMILITQVFQKLFLYHHLQIMFILGSRIRVAFMNMIYIKVFLNSFLRNYLLLFVKTKFQIISSGGKVSKANEIESKANKKASKTSKKASNDEKQKSKLFSDGEIITLINNHSQNFVNILTNLNNIWSALLQVIICVAMLWSYIGLGALSGLVVMLVCMPFNYLLADRIKRLEEKKYKVTNILSQKINELLNSIMVGIQQFIFSSSYFVK